MLLPPIYIRLHPSPFLTSSKKANAVYIFYNPLSTTFYVYCFGNLQRLLLFSWSPFAVLGLLIFLFMAILKSFDICVPAIAAE